MNIMTFTPLDVALILAYFTGVILIGTLGSRRQKSDLEDYLVAGRRVTLFPFVATLVTTWYGGILGVGEYSYQYGIANWIAFGFFYYFWAVIYAMLMSKRVHRAHHYTIPDELTAAYDRKTGLLGAIFTFAMTVPAAYILMIGTMIQLIFGWSLATSVIVGTFFSIGYILIGGFRSVVRTDIVQFVFMFLGFGLILPFAIIKFGGFDFLRSNLPATHWDPTGGMHFQEIFVWFFIAAGTMVDPGFYQRCTAAQTEKTAQKGIFIAIGFWFLFDLMTTSAGLYARAILPKLDNPVMAYPMLAEHVLPTVFKAIFFIGMLSTIMSTIDSNTFLAAMTLGRDVIWRWKSDPAAEPQVGIYTQMGLILTGIASVIMALYFESVIDIWKTVGSIGTPVLFLPLMTSLYTRWRVSANVVFGSMVLTTIVTGSWVIWGETQGAYPFGIEPIYPGLLTSAVIFGIGLWQFREKSFG